MSDNIARQKWTRGKQEVRNKPKWLKLGTLVIIKPAIAPQEIEIDGKWGPRKVWVLATKEYGLIYVTPLQYVKIAEVVEAANFEDVTVEV